MTFCSSFDNDISSVAIEQSSAEDVLAAGMLVADVFSQSPYCRCRKQNSFVVFKCKTRKITIHLQSK
jgi:hypothetical protein